MFLSMHLADLINVIYAWFVSMRPREKDKHNFLPLLPSVGRQHDKSMCCWVLSVTDHFYSLLLSAVCDSQSLAANWKHITSAKRTIIHLPSLGNSIPSVMMASGHILFLSKKYMYLSATAENRKCIHQKLVVETCAGYWRWWWWVWNVITSRWSVIFALGVAEERPVWAQIIKKLNPIVFIALLC